MKKFHHSNGEILENFLDFREENPAKSRYLFDTPLYNANYHEPSVNQQEMEDFHEPNSIMIRHSDSTSIGLKGILSSHPRPDAEGILDAPLLEFDLKKEIQHIKLDGNWAAGKQTVKALAKSEYMSVVLIALQKANEIKMHQANGPITLQVMEGNIQFMTWQSCVTIKGGQFITLHKNVQHNILAKDQSIILLTIMHANSPDKGVQTITASDWDPNVSIHMRKIKMQDNYGHKKNKEMSEENKSKTEEKEIEEKEQEVIETSENINFPHFPTYPPEDDVYKEPEETIETEEK